MLVISRRIGDWIIIDNDIHVRIIAVRGNVVRLGIDAPPSVLVDREEIHRQRVSFDEQPMHR